MSGQGSFVPTDDFYPRPPRGGRRGMADTEIHWAIFLSTPSARRATWSFRFLCRFFAHFYPRPPRGGRPHTYALKYYLFEFLSTPSARRATTCPEAVAAYEKEFLSTPSARRATDEGRPPVMTTEISIHALREEGDAGDPRLHRDHQHFYPRPPRGGRRRRPRRHHERRQISIHALREEGDKSLVEVRFLEF